MPPNGLFKSVSAMAGWLSAAAKLDQITNAVGAVDDREFEVDA